MLLRPTVKDSSKSLQSNSLPIAKEPLKSCIPIPYKKQISNQPLKVSTKKFEVSYEPVIKPFFIADIYGII